MKNLWNYILNIGVKASYLSWEGNLTRRLNVLTLISFSNVLIGVLFLNFIGFNHFNSECIFALIVLPLVFFLNKYKNYVWAIFWFFFTSFLFLIPVTLKMGIDSYVILYYFPMIIAMMHLLGRKETYSLMLIFSGFFALSIITVAVGFNFNYYQLDFDKNFLDVIKIFNILLSFTSTSMITLYLVSDFIKQENIIKNVLKEKEILLAEVFHRVKNNLNVITSLLNLKKNSVQSLEAQLALEECKNRVYSMALIHQNIFEGNKIIGINFREYIEQLVSEIAKSFGEKEKVYLFFDTDEIEFDINKAVPIGLILNELITNSFKHAQTNENQLEITVKFKNNNNRIELELSDNGPGITQEELESKDTLGLELIKSLSEQISADYTFENNNGSTFRLAFR